MSYSVVKVDEVEGEGPAGALDFMRRRLGGEAFGIDWYEIPPNGEDVPIKARTFLRLDPRPCGVPSWGRTDWR